MEVSYSEELPSGSEVQYGPRDLTSIVDERLSEQSQALLASWTSKLCTYVPTLSGSESLTAPQRLGRDRQAGWRFPL